MCTRHRMLPVTLIADRNAETINQYTGVTFKLALNVHCQTQFLAPSREQLQEPIDQLQKSRPATLTASVLPIYQFPDKHTTQRSEAWRQKSALDCEINRIGTVRDVDMEVMPKVRVMGSRSRSNYLITAYLVHGKKKWATQPHCYLLGTLLCPREAVHRCMKNHRKFYLLADMGDLEGFKRLVEECSWIWVFHLCALPRGVRLKSAWCLAASACMR
ncbi:hypothetical protein DFH08DRAFT_824617 [Mycena albidolilacea]|uniref:Uncharacterized protein n=1 Tax=Mycena albidolilacea TaxID=1033008 RepID=A0AAD7EAP0_9AGAR|nr:hypothetical protein DFH08DRAFT_824617 [Mycena albidolilacea]